MMAVTPATTPTPAENTQLLPIEEAIQSTKDRFFNWTSIAIHLPKAMLEGETAPPLKLDLTRPEYTPSRAWAPVEVDPYTGKILQVTTFQDRSARLRARLWNRFLHTGADLASVGRLSQRSPQSVHCFLSIRDLL